ncbi:MAG TPA: helix-turn-helix domain-containing protein [Solirubrobacteraceae bacterium]|nr:helix-turn-helix domain-containing protein [Solirubrobacteraceae bacterium]
MPLGNTYRGQTCSIASALEVVGERWTLLIVRQVMLGVRRFDEIQRDLGIARNVLQARLEHLERAGILERRRYHDSPIRYEYRLTEAGRDLWPVLVSLLQWGDAHLPRDEGPPVHLEHRGCGGAVDTHRMCTRCGAALEYGDVVGRPGRDLPAGHPLLRRAAAAVSAGG